MIGLILIFLSLALLYSLYGWALPKPIPGIPYEATATKSLWGNMSEIMAFKKRHGEVRPWFARQAVRHRAPLTQAWLTPFSRPVLILSDYREAQDVFLRRSRDFFRGPRSCDAFHGSIPEHHIAMMSADPRFKRNKELVRDLMTPGFLHDVSGFRPGGGGGDGDGVGVVSAPQIHAKSMMLVDLWTQKSRLAQGRPFDALADLFDVAMDMINAAAFALDDDMSTTKAQLDFLSSSSSSSSNSPDSGGDNAWSPVTSAGPHGGVQFPRPPELPDIAACRALAGHVGVLFNSLAPRLEDRWRMLTSARLRASVKRKDRMIARAIERSLERMGRGGGGGKEAVPTSALDHLLAREKAAAMKAGREPDCHSRKIYDEVRGIPFLDIMRDKKTRALIYATSSSWGMIKLLATHQAVQARLRGTLRATYAAAAAESRQPTAQEVALASAPYLDAVIEESLRYAPPIPLLIRTARADTTLLGHAVPRGTDVFMPALGPGYTAPAAAVVVEAVRSESSRTKGWGGRWDEGDMHLFRPERWLKADEEDGSKQSFDPQAGPMITFGLGLRSCFGKRLAYLEMRMMLALLVWNFKFEKLEGPLASNQANESITTYPKSCYVALEKLSL
ncbi:uncharacterized protein PG986_010901 [Apiospora aurea]|uniref:Cytochrome P450 monooxygenase n=1 Tax=Apiospora aurea TaxID=335848 RepID=A0ABR1Q3L2_9PEZI